MGKPINITGEQFEAEVLNSQGMVLVDFWGDGCAPCKAMVPVLEKIAAERANLNVVKINFMDATDLAVDLGISGLPTLLLYRDGKLLGRQVGLKSKASLEQWMDEA